MKPLFPIALIIISLLALTIPFLILFFQMRKVDAPIRSLVRNLLYSKKIEFFIGLLSYLIILVGAVGLLVETQWGRPLVLIGLATLLVYVWIENIWKIFYFRNLNSKKVSPLRGELESKMKNIFEPMNVDILNEVSLDDNFYKLAARKKIFQNP